MKNTILRPISLCMSLLLATTFSCSHDEELLEMEQEQLNIDDTLASKTKGPKSSSGSCDNPNNSREYQWVDVRPQGSNVGDYVPRNGVDKITYIDDRSCEYNYEQEKRGRYEYGKYRITSGTNYFDNFQERMERSTATVSNRNGSYTRVQGFVRIRSVGSPTNSASQNSFSDNSGTYIMQAKGTHSNRTIGSKDPAILLLLAKPASNGYFNIYQERITKRGGSGASGRKLEYVTRVRGDRRIFVKMTNGFTNNRQYVDYKINGVSKRFYVPDTRLSDGRTQKGQNAKIRFGAYRCKSGQADIWWSDVKHYQRNR